MFNTFLTTAEHHTVIVVLLCNLHAYLFLNCCKIFKRTVFYNCSLKAQDSVRPHQLHHPKYGSGSTKRRKSQTFKMTFIMTAAGMQYSLKCVLYTVIYITYNYIQLQHVYFLINYSDTALHSSKTNRYMSFITDVI